MLEKQSLWLRIGSWVRPRSDHTQPLLATVDNRVDFDMTDEDVSAQPAAPKATVRRMPWRRRGETLGQIRTGYDKVLDLVDSIQRHLAKQNHCSADMAGSLTELAKGMSALPEAARNQTDRLRRLTDELEASNQQLEGVAGIIHDWPRAALAQKKALESIAIQLESSAAATDRLSERLDSLGQTVKMLTDASTQEVDCLRHLQYCAERQETRLSTLIENQTRRFTLLFACTTLMAVTVAVASVLGMLL